MDKTAMMLLIDKLNDHINKHKDNTGRFDTGAMVARNFAITLLEKEQDQLEDAFDAGTIDLNRTGSTYYKQKYRDDNEEWSGLERLRVLQVQVG